MDQSETLGRRARQRADPSQAFLMKGLIFSELTIQEQAVWPNEEFRTWIKRRIVVLRVLLGDSEVKINKFDAVFESVLKFTAK